MLHEYINSSIGDEKAEELCVHLMQSACVPYMNMLSMWIYKGIISDPIKEVHLFILLKNNVTINTVPFSSSLLKIMRWYKKKICLLIIPQIIG